MTSQLKNHIEYLLCINNNSVRSLLGGDISWAYLLKTEWKRFFCKVNDSQHGFSMFSAEEEGLKPISETHPVAFPNVLLCETLEKIGLLLIDPSSYFGH